jgi:RNA polymerase sigma-70 factor (ECF subfamily)
MCEVINGAMITPDADLVGLARLGDRPAREELFGRHFGVAKRVAYRLLGNEQDALDAVQDGMMKALIHLKDFDGRSRFLTWLLRIVSNSAHDLGRRRRRRPWVSLDETAHDDSAGLEFGSRESLDPAAGLHREDQRKALNSALEKLTPATRATFVLFAEAELSYKDIAECQDVPIGTVMSRLHYARQKLQGYLEESRVGA